MRVNVLKAFALIFFLGLTSAAFGQAPIAAITMTNTSWKYNAGGTNLGVAWKGITYNDAFWQTGFGCFATGYVGVAASPLSAQTRTSLPLTNAANSKITTYYFRNHFTVTNANRYEIGVAVTNLIDDGAVFYVNSNEVFRLNMPNGGVSFITTASSSVDAAMICSLSLLC